ncbi:MAG: hypothetical protein E6G69_11280 [Alphaproteobacteria bacterium]|nr:MAG: hypothetical protein E6G69_11280 [Alphaproteobacteria bacterium]
MPVLVDSGFRRGTDIIKALAMGAQAVCIGRPYLWGLGAFGQTGIGRLAAGGNRIRTRGPMSGGEPARTNELSSHHNCGGRSELSPNLMRDERLQFLPQHRRDPG